MGEGSEALPHPRPLQALGREGNFDLRDRRQVLGCRGPRKALPLAEARRCGRSDKGGQRRRALRIGRMMGRQHHREPVLILEVADEVQHVEPERRPERREGLVQQQNRAAADERAGNRHPLPFSAGQLARKPSLETGEPDAFEGCCKDGPIGIAEAQGRGDAERHVCIDIEMEEQIVLLKQHGHRPFLRRLGRDVPRADHNAARQWRLEAGDQVEQRRLAGAARPDHRDERVRRNLGREQHAHVFVIEADIRQRDRRARHWLRAEGEAVGRPASRPTRMRARQNRQG